MSEMILDSTPNPNNTKQQSHNVNNYTKSETISDVTTKNIWSGIQNNFWHDHKIF